MESGGSGARESGGEGDVEYSIAPKAQGATDEPLGALVAGLSNLSEDELLSVIGAYEVTPDQRLRAVIRLYALGEVAASIEGAGLAARTYVDLAALGRRRVQRVLADCGETIKPHVCDLWHGNAPLRELVLGIANALTLLLSVVAAVLAAIALAIARFYLEELCGPREKRVRRYAF
jgi:hypothetical protein